MAIPSAVQVPGEQGRAAHLETVGYAPSISRRDSTRSIKGRMPNSLEMARDSSSRDMGWARSPRVVQSQAVQRPLTAC